MRSFLGSTGSKAIELSPAEYRGGEAMTFWDPNGNGHAFRYTGLKSAREAYEKCSPLTTIINRKAQSYANGVSWILNREGKAKGKESNSVAADKMRKLMSRPNPYATWAEFDARVYMNVQLFGFCVVLPMMGVGFESYGPIEATSLWIIPAHILDIKERSGLFYKRGTKLKDSIESIKVSWGGEDSYLNLDAVFIFRDQVISFDSMVIPSSRIQALETPINNIIGAMESRNTLINYRGSNGIFSHDPGSSQYAPMAMDDKDKKALQEDFRKYGLRKKQWQYIITTAAIKWTPIGKPTKELMLFEEVIDSSKMICDQYGFPPYLLGLVDPTFNNQNTAEKGVYQNTVMPEAKVMVEGWNRFFRTDEYKVIIDKDFSHIPVLQEDEKEKADARRIRNEAYKIEWLAGNCTRNEWRLANGDDPLPPEIGDVYYTPPAQPENNQNGTSNNQPG